VWLRSALVADEIAIALVLLAASGLLLRSFEKMLAVDLSFRPDFLRGYAPVRFHRPCGRNHNPYCLRLSSTLKRRHPWTFCQCPWPAYSV
jgi:hypothetical protein